MHTFVPSGPVQKHQLCSFSRQEVKNISQSLAFYKIYCLLHVSAFVTAIVRQLKI